VVAAAVVLVLLLGGSDSKSGPAAAVDKLLKADVKRDAKAAQAVTCEPLKSQLNLTAPADKSYKIGKTTEKGNSATVVATIVDSENKTSNVLFDVQKQGGTWKVCDGQDLGTGSGGGSSQTSSAGTGAPSGFPTDLPSGIPTDFPSGGIPSLPSGFPTGGGTGSICITPNGSTPLCIPN
jgi:hypothetical protein